VLTDRYQAARSGRSLVETVARAVDAGAPAILFREKDLAPRDRQDLGEEVAARCAGAELIVASDPTLARHLGAGTVHLATADTWPDADDLVVGRSCHSDDELAEAAEHQAEYATLSPVFDTTSKPGYGPPLGLDTFAELVAATPVPVVALGGIDATNTPRCLEAGAAGVAVMGAVMAAPDPGAAVRELLSAGAAP